VPLKAKQWPYAIAGVHNHHGWYSINWLVKNIYIYVYMYVDIYILYICIYIY
jgi:hypothetical protein